MNKLWKDITKKFGNGFTFMIVPNSPHEVKSLPVSFPLLIIIVGVIAVNIYIFVMFTAQVFQIYHIQQELNQKSRNIVKLEKEQKEAKPSLNRTYQIASELSSLKAEREKILQTWRSVQKTDKR